MTDDPIEQAARVLCAADGADPDAPEWDHDDEGRRTTWEHAWVAYVATAVALADAGLLVRALPSREAIADVILAESLFGSRTSIVAADAVLTLLKGHGR